MSASVGTLSNLLQTERSSAIEALIGVSDGAPDAFLADARLTDQAVTEYLKVRAGLPYVSTNLSDLVSRVDRELGELPTLRQQIVAGTVAGSATAFRYRIMIGDLVTYRESIAQSGGAEGDLADRIRAAASLSAAAEYAGAERTTVQRALAGGELLPATQQEITASRSGYLEAMRTFDVLAPDSWRAWVEQSMSGLEAVQAQLLEDAVSRTRPGARLDVNRIYWSQAMNARLAHLNLIQDLVDRDLVVDVTKFRDAQRLSAGLQGMAVLVTVALALWLAVQLGRPVVLGLRRLRDAAHRVAAVDLPEAVARLGDAESIGDSSPEQFATQMTKLLPEKGSDELAEVARAFNAVHTEAVRVAAEQAVLRLQIARMFVELARRGNSLTARLTKALDDAEQREENPEWLERLFSFDHMVTLLARRNNSLLVLGGSSPAQARVHDEPVADVLKAAQGQVEHYTRVHFSEVADGVAVKAHVVDEMVILLAELIDNATRFSKHVQVSASALADRTIIQISDDGIGIEPPLRESLNGRLAYPKLDLEALHSMGMTVVGTIATRHGITVELRANRPTGTIAEVAVPVSLLDKEKPRPEAPAARRPKAKAVAAPLFQRAEPREVLEEAETTAELTVESETAEPTVEPVTAEPGVPTPTLLFAGTGSPGVRNEPTSVAVEETMAESEAPEPVKANGTLPTRRPSPWPRPGMEMPRVKPEVAPGEAGADGETVVAQAEAEVVMDEAAADAGTVAAQAEPVVPDEADGETVVAQAEPAPEPDPEPSDVPVDVNTTATDTPIDAATDVPTTETTTATDVPTDTLTEQKTLALPIIPPPAVPKQREPVEDGWNTVSEAANALLTSELPRRAPMAHLVPGGLPEPGTTVPTAPSDYRDPDSVGATFAAYARGTSNSKNAMSVTTSDREPDSDPA